MQYENRDYLILFYHNSLVSVIEWMFNSYLLDEWMSKWSDVSKAEK